MLGKAHRLDLSDCKGITDISSLGKVSILDISGMMLSRRASPLTLQSNNSLLMLTVFVLFLVFIKIVVLR
jgi:hypothetical protein